MMNYLRLSLLIAFAIFALFCVGYAHTKFTPKRQTAQTCAINSLTCSESKSALAE
jgi:hypothetical protein